MMMNKDESNLIKVMPKIKALTQRHNLPQQYPERPHVRVMAVHVVEQRLGRHPAHRQRRAGGARGGAGAARHAEVRDLAQLVVVY